MTGRGWLVGVALACAALGAGGCSFDGSLEEYCESTGDCLCEGGSCCVRAGRVCGGEGGECCGTLTCSSGRCQARGGGLAIEGPNAPLVQPDVGVPRDVTLRVVSTGQAGAAARQLTVRLSGSGTFQLLDAAACEGATLEGGQSCEVRVRYTPRVLSVRDTAELQVEDLEGRTATLGLSGHAGLELTVALADRRSGGRDAGAYVVSEPPGILCPPACNARFPLDGGVLLRDLHADAGFSVHLTGGGCDGGATCALAPLEPTVRVDAVIEGWLKVRTEVAPGSPVSYSTAGLAMDAGSLVVLCSPCSYDTQGPVTLTAWASNTLGLTGWGGACADAGLVGACAVDVQGPTEVVLQAGPLNAVFVTEEVPGQLGGLAGADARCASAAASGDVGRNTYRAYLAVAGAPPHTRLAGARGWYARNFAYDNVGALADRPEDLAVSRFFTPGATFTRYYAYEAATGTLADGGVATGETCADWTSSQGTHRPGDPSGGASAWLRKPDAGARSCGERTYLYCFGTERVVLPLPLRPR